MNDIERLVRRLTRNCRREMVSETIPFYYPIEELGIDLNGYQISIYDPAFSPYFHRRSDGTIIVAMNTYLSSFVAEIAVVWLVHGNPSNEHDQQHLDRLLRYNLKKFFAEQILHLGGNAFGRAIFFETLLYEQELMVEVHKIRNNSREIQEYYDAIVEVSESLLLFHEIAHMVQDLTPDFSKRFRSELPGAGLSELWCEEDTQLVRDLEADAFSVGMANTMNFGALSKDEKLDVFAFCHIVFACMNSLYVSAEATVNANLGAPDFRSEVHRNLPSATYVLDIVPVYKKRANSVLTLVKSLAGKTSADQATTVDNTKYRNFGDPKSIGLTFDRIVRGLISDENPKYRPMCELVANALHDNKEGMEFLIWRSKKYNLPEGREIPPPVNGSGVK